MYFIEKTITNMLTKEQLPKDFNSEDAVFFDIETSGLSPKTSFIFLIGLLFIKNDNLILRQYFGQSIKDEINVLNNFLEDISHYKQIYNYNGTSFDFPFIMQRLEINNIDYCLETYENIDLYKILIKNKGLLKLKRYKLKNIEEYLNINRIDNFSGREIVQQYRNYQTTKDNELRLSILLHNEEDVINLYRIMPILNEIISYKELESSKISNFKICLTDETVTFHGIINDDYHTFNCENELYSLNHNKNNKQFTLIFNNYAGEIYYCFENYKDYYYFPELSQVIHKSVAKFYKEHKYIKADKDNCFIKLNTKYINLPINYFSNTIKICKNETGGFNNCLPLDEISKCLEDESRMDILKDIIYKSVKKII